jgi:hypothetical protein
MSFQPVFSIVRIPTDAKSVYVKDETPTGGTGYGSTYAPADFDAVTSLFMQLIPYGGSASTGTIIAGGDFTEETGYTITIPDGVITIVMNYGLQVTLTGNIASDRMSMVLTNAETLLAGVTFISLDGIEFVEIESITETNLVTFKTPLPGSASVIGAFYKYYSGEQTSLILFQANKAIVREIDKLVNCSPNFNTRKGMIKIMLKESAQREYALGNLAKANEAALLISGNQPVYNSNCLSCD